MDGEKIKKLRQKLGVSQYKFADLLGMGYGAFVTVNRWENKKSKPSRLAILRIEQLMKDKGITLEELEEKPKANRRRTKEVAQ